MGVAQLYPENAIAAIAASLSAQAILCLDEAMIERAKSFGMNVVAV